MQSIIMVFIGGGLGSLCRYSIARMVQPYNLVFPWATLIANIISCIVLGALIGWSLKHTMGSPMKLLWLTGFCGGFSTFSTFTYETFHLLETGNISYAFLNIGISLLICLGCMWLGISLFR